MRSLYGLRCPMKHGVETDSQRFTGQTLFQLKCFFSQKNNPFFIIIKLDHFHCSYGFHKILKCVTGGHFRLSGNCKRFKFCHLSNKTALIFNKSPTQTPMLNATVIDSYRISILGCAMPQIFFFVSLHMQFVTNYL